MPNPEKPPEPAYRHDKDTVYQVVGPRPEDVVIVYDHLDSPREAADICTLLNFGYPSDWARLKPILERFRSGRGAPPYAATAALEIGDLVRTGDGFTLIVVPTEHGLAATDGDSTLDLGRLASAGWRVIDPCDAGDNTRLWNLQRALSRAIYRLNQPRRRQVAAAARNILINELKLDRDAVRALIVEKLAQFINPDHFDIAARVARARTLVEETIKLRLDRETVQLIARVHDVANRTTAEFARAEAELKAQVRAAIDGFVERAATLADRGYDAAVEGAAKQAVLEYFEERLEIRIKE